MKKLILILAIALILGACTTNPKNIEAAYVSPQKYANYDCQQLAMEAANIERKVNDLYGHLKKESSKDGWATGVGIVLFWPALFFLAGNDDLKEAEYAQLKGDYEAIQSAQVQKRCTIMPAPATVVSSDKSAGQVANVTVDAPETQLRVVSETDKTNCVFIKSIAKASGGSGDVSIYVEEAMSKALSDAASAGADSYFIADVSTTSTGASVVLEALNCNGIKKATSAVKSSDTYNYYVNATGEDPYEAIKAKKKPNKQRPTV